MMTSWPAFAALTPPLIPCTVDVGHTLCPAHFPSPTVARATSRQEVPLLQYTVTLADHTDRPASVHVVFLHLAVSCSLCKPEHSCLLLLVCEKEYGLHCSPWAPDIGPRVCASSKAGDKRADPPGHDDRPG